MRAVICERFGGPEVLAVREVRDPLPPERGEIQVRIRARGAQYVDVLMLRGEYQFRPEPPFIPGGEAAGEIIALGPGVERFKVGDRVMTRHAPGSFCEIANAKAATADHVPPGYGFEEAAVLRGAYHTAYHALVRAARLKAGEWVLVHGASGGIGMAAIDLARLYGAKVIATGGSDEKLAACAARGADHVINIAALPGFRDRVKALTDGRGVDVVYDPIGGDVFDESMRCLVWGARLLILGFVGGRPALARTNHLLIKGASAIGVRLGGVQEFEPDIAAANMRTILDLAGEGRIRPHISHRFPLERAADALQAIIDRKVVGKAVIVG